MPFFIFFSRFFISIHAPTKGATFMIIVDIVSYPYFNPRSHEGSDCQDSFVLPSLLPFQSTLPRRERRYVTFPVCVMKSFQSTLPRRERLLLEHTITMVMYFNPRSHEGSDNITWDSHGLLCISIHAPTKGATVTVFFLVLSHMYFNPRSHEGSDSNIAQNNEFILWNIDK